MGNYDEHSGPVIWLWLSYVKCVTAESFQVDKKKSLATLSMCDIWPVFLSSCARFGRVFQCSKFLLLLGNKFSYHNNTVGCSRILHRPLYKDVKRKLINIQQKYVYSKVNKSTQFCFSFWWSLFKTNTKTSDNCAHISFFERKLSKLVELLNINKRWYSEGRYEQPHLWPEGTWNSENSFCISRLRKRIARKCRTHCVSVLNTFIHEFSSSNTFQHGHLSG